MKRKITHNIPHTMSTQHPDNVRTQIKKVLRITNFQTNTEHQKITSQIIHCLQNQQTENLPELIAAAGRIRRFLG